MGEPQDGMQIVTKESNLLQRYALASWMGVERKDADK